MLSDATLIVLLLLLLSFKVTIIGIAITRDLREGLRLLGLINAKSSFPVGHAMNPIRLEKSQTPDMVKQILERARDRER